MSRIKKLVFTLIWIGQMSRLIRADYALLGCFSDPIQNDFVGSVLTFGVLDIKTCMNACKGYRYFAIQNTYFKIIVFQGST
jgi:hypothetical protein